MHACSLIPIASYHLADNITRADSLSYDIVDCMQLFTRDNLLKDLSPPATDTAWNSYMYVDIPYKVIIIATYSI